MMVIPIEMNGLRLMTLNYLQKRRNLFFYVNKSNYFTVIATMSQASLPQKVLDTTSKVKEEVQITGHNDKTNKTKVEQSQRINKPKENKTAQENESKLVTDLDIKDRGKSPSTKDKHNIQKHAHKVPETSNSLSASRLQKIQSEKQTIEHQLKQLDKEICEIRQEQRSKSILHRREEISNNRQARKIAISLVKNHRARKREFQEKKKAHDEKTLHFLRQQFQQANKKRQQHEKLVQQQKRRVISLRMNEGKKQVEERKEFQKLSNQLINRLLKEEEMLKQKSIESPIQESQPVVRVVERIPQIDFIQIEKHEQAYLQQKEEFAKKKEGSISISHPIKKYEKTRWAERLQEASQRQRQEEKQKELERQLRMEKRMKYGQLIHSLFVKKNKVRTENSLEKANVNSQSILVTPNKQRKARESIKKGRDSFINSNPNTVFRQQKKQLSPEQIQQKDNRQRQLRKQTVQRLKKIESSDIKNLPQKQSKYQSKYQNYLGQIKRKKRDESEKWTSILNNKDMSKQQKYTSMLKKAMALQNKAKFKQSLHKESPDEAVELYLDSIQAKLTLLQNI